MQELHFLVGECIVMRVCVCVGREFLIQRFVSHSLVVMNHVVLKICEVLSSGIIQYHFT